MPRPNRNARRRTTDLDGTPTKQAAGLMSKLFNKKPEREDCVVVQADVHAPPPMSSYTMAVRNVDDFVPDGDASFNSFLEERDADGGAAVPSALEEESASDEEDSGGNPLVTGFQDDVDPEDFCPGRVAGDILASAMPVSNRDSQDDEDALCGGGDFARELCEDSKGFGVLLHDAMSRRRILNVIIETVILTLFKHFRYYVITSQQTINGNTIINTHKHSPTT
ncbi:hypothetical protein HPB51_014912 [Rhipicephalus microplus]|uniref:Uncharacterized protein n=1 Tax=Rhipicephalus microplus TaxID=6941 RepID=A0A9J6EHC1_RHIMP|nr:hypothetical protein HPB51_014912 [Rhipicephalus microplus]